MNDKPIVIEHEFKAPAELVWRAITEKELMKKWYFDIPNFNLEVGSTFEFEGGVADRCYVHQCEILEVEPFKKLKYSWKYKGHAGLSFVTFELFPDGDKTKLILTHDAIETFPEDNRDFKKTNFGFGWHLLVRQSLRAFVEEGKATREKSST